MVLLYRANTMPLAFSVKKNTEENSRNHLQLNNNNFAMMTIICFDLETFNQPHAARQQVTHKDKPQTLTNE